MPYTFRNGASLCNAMAVSALTRFSEEAFMIISAYFPQSVCVSRALLCVVLASLLCVTGCASRYGTQKTAINHYPDCYAPINELRQSENTAPKYAAGGAAAGAAIGALLGYLTTGKASGALVGGAAGAVAGGAAGGIYGHQRQQQEDASQLAAYNSQLDSGIREVSKATAAARVARQCYERQFTVAAAEYKAGRLSREEFNSRYHEVVSGMEEAADILGTANRKNSGVTAEYQRVLQQESTPVANARQVKNSRETSREAKQQIAELKNKTNTMQKSVSAGEEEERLLLQRLSMTHKQAQDLMS
jgi:outer membrane lipoprotein SlyB